MSGAVTVCDAPLPSVYVEARASLERCESIDECREWKNKAEAIASYARQAEDETLLALAQRIRARAIRRCGELLAKVEKAQGGRPSKTSAGSGTSSRKSVARAAGLSHRQQHTALKIAAIPKARFEREVESEKPPTITKLAAIEKKLTAHPDPSSELYAKHLVRDLRNDSDYFTAIEDLPSVARAVPEKEVAALIKNIATVQKFLTRFTAQLQKRKVA